MIQQGDYLWLSDGSISALEKTYLTSPDMYDLSFIIKLTRSRSQNILFHDLPVKTACYQP